MAQGTARIDTALIGPPRKPNPLPATLLVLEIVLNTQGERCPRLFCRLHYHNHKLYSVLLPIPTLLATGFLNYYKIKLQDGQERSFPETEAFKINKNVPQRVKYNKFRSNTSKIQEYLKCKIFFYKVDTETSKKLPKCMST